jgi:hypothetical protein
MARLSTRGTYDPGMLAAYWDGPADPRFALGDTAPPSTYDRGTHRPADQLAQAIELEAARARRARGLGEYIYQPGTHRPADQLAQAVELERWARARGLAGLYAVDPPGGGPVPVPPGGMPGKWIDDHNYRDAAGYLWHVYPPTDPGSLTKQWGASSEHYDAGGIISNPTREGLATAIDSRVGLSSVPASVATQAVVSAARTGFVVGAISATLAIGTVTAIVLLVRGRRRSSSHRSNPRRRRRR